MPDSPQSVGSLARPLIEQCRRDIAAAWEQVEAGRRILANSRWLLKRWAEQARQAERAAAAQPAEPRRAMGGTFEPVETETPRERLHSRASIRSRARARMAAVDHRRQSSAAP